MSAITNKRDHLFWSEQKDQFIIDQVSLHKNKYSAVTNLFNKTFSDSKTSKQIRERYLNHLSPGLNKTPFSDKEKTFILSKVEEMGNRWESIAKMMQGRTANNVKNFYNSFKRSSALISANIPSPIETKQDTPIEGPDQPNMEGIKEKPKNNAQDVANSFITMLAPFAAATPPPMEEENRSTPFPITSPIIASERNTSAKTLDQAPKQKKPNSGKSVDWTKEKDQFLKDNHKFYANKPSVYTNFANAFNKHFGTKLKPKQIRERYITHIAEGILKTPFSQQEDTTILRLIKKLGTKWATIAHSLPGRTAEAIKNRYNGNLKKNNLENMTPQDQNNPLDKANQTCNLEDPCNLKDLGGISSNSSVYPFGQGITLPASNEMSFRSPEILEDHHEDHYKEFLSDFFLEDQNTPSSLQESSNRSS